MIALQQSHNINTPNGDNPHCSVCEAQMPADTMCDSMGHSKQKKTLQICGNRALTQKKKMKKNSATKPMNHSMTRKGMNSMHNNTRWRKD